MAELTRRRFLTFTSLGVAGAAAAVVGGVELVSHVHEPHAAAAGAAPRTEPIVLMVRDAASGEVALMVGTSEKTYRDPDLVGRLVGAASQVGR